MTEKLQIDKIAVETLFVPIVGTSPLIIHNFSEKSKRMMLDAQQGKKKIKEVRDPQAEYESAFYRIANEDGPDKYGFPVTGFKAATAGAARFYGKSVSMTSLRQFLFMHGVLTKADPQQLVEIVGEPNMREDVVPLHSRFEWDDEVAGEEYRRIQAAELIRSVRIVYERSPDGDGSVRAWQVVRDPDDQPASYRPVEEIVADPLRLKILLRDMERDWKSFKVRYAHLKEFADLINGEAA